MPKKQKSAEDTQSPYPQMDFESFGMNMPNMASMPNVNFNDNRFVQVWQKFITSLGTNQKFLSDMAQSQAQQHSELLSQFAPNDANGKEVSKDKVNKPDRKFTHPSWDENPFYKYLKESYKLNTKLLFAAVDEHDFDATEKQMLHFMLKQLTSAMSPANFPLTNPEVAEETIKSQGENIKKGMENYMADLQSGAITLSDPDAFTVGDNLAITKGKVIFQNHLMQLIEYSPTTDKVHAKPLLIVPPCINKYYILDLTQEDSFIKYLLDKGIRVFLISWVNATEQHNSITWDDYVSAGVIEAVDTVATIAKVPTINTLGYCIGGTLLASALAVMQKNNDEKIATMSLMTSFLDFCDTGEIGLFVDEKFVDEIEEKFEDGGLFSGLDLQRTFGYLRPDDLIWPYVIKNYMLGKKPQAFNILHWNCDSTNLPGKMYAWYLRHTYLDNDIKDGVEICGCDVDLKNLNIPGMVIACEKDHIVPWKAAYESAKLLGKDAEFILSSSGHVAGVINPEYKKKGYHFIASKKSALVKDAEKWLAAAKQSDGSWWPSFITWLAKHSDKKVPATKKLGDYRHLPIEDAPGSYVTAPLLKVN